ncbi:MULTISPECIES: hypothetical protein [Calothrix]|uniref:Uncharacterized protein n=2 Tax=Calothrix TaxID=1186 RepID=A0ABR8ALK0_9CYAN|nr:MULTISPECIES: hypothetical protein [Calothrix]MBD2200168.1 hypothetical protein [Calothrix parietina FACHB-288]MBD2229122.1 hypothetical protein [Calothrix anomala FACHB-343]
MGTIISLVTLGLLIHQATQLNNMKGIIKDTEHISKTLDELDELDKEQAPE